MNIEFDYSRFSPGDLVLVSNSKAWTSYRLGVITRTKSHSVDAIIYLDGGLEYRTDIWHEDDPRLDRVKDGTAIIRGVFKEADITLRLKKVEEILERLSGIERSLEALQELVRGRKNNPFQNRGSVDPAAGAGQRS